MDWNTKRIADSFHGTFYISTTEDFYEKSKCRIVEVDSELKIIYASGDDCFWFANGTGTNIIK